MIVTYDCPDCGEKVTGELSKSSKQAICEKCGTRSNIVFKWVEPGMVIGNGYRIKEKLDEDSQSKLFLAYQEAMDRDVVLKILPADIAEDEEEFQRFQREVKLAAAVTHPHILAAFGAGEDCGIHFLIRQHKPGESLEAIIRREGALPEKDTIKKLIPIAEALSHAWNEKKVLHRNLKPEVILFAEDGSSMLMDLGIAKSMESNNMNITRVGFTVGTPEYMSPEQVRGSQDLDCRSDIYSFCIVLYRALTGEVPFEDPSAMVVMQKQLNDAPVPAQFKNSDISTMCSTMIDMGLSKAADERFQTWQDLIDRMKSVIRGEDRHSRKDKGSAPGKPKQRPHKKRPVKKSQPQGGVSRKDVERIADQMYGAKYRRNRIILYLMVPIIALLLVGLPLYMANQAKVKRRKVDDLLMQAQELETDRKYDEAVQRLMEARKLADVDSEQYTEAKRRIIDVNVRKIMWMLRNQAVQYIKTGQNTKAAQVYQNYTGPYASETAELREREVNHLRGSRPRRRK